MDQKIRNRLGKLFSAKGWRAQLLGNQAQHHGHIFFQRAGANVQHVSAYAEVDAGPNGLQLFSDGKLVLHFGALV